MPHGYSPRAGTLIGVLVLLVVSGLVYRTVFQRSMQPPVGCPRVWSQTQLAALLLWETSAGVVVGDGAPAVWHQSPADLRGLATDTDRIACERLFAAIPDTFRFNGPRPPWMVSFFQAGDRYVVPIVKWVSPEAMMAEEEGGPIVDAAGVTYVFDAGFELLGTTPN